jgi:hypothetical protein
MLIAFFVYKLIIRSHQDETTTCTFAGPWSHDWRQPSHTAILDDPTPGDSSGDKSRRSVKDMDLKVSPNGRYFIDQHGKPFFYLGDKEGPAKSGLYGLLVGRSGGAHRTIYQ